MLILSFYLVSRTTFGLYINNVRVYNCVLSSTNGGCMFTYKIDKTDKNKIKKIKFDYFE